MTTLPPGSPNQSIITHHPFADPVVELVALSLGCEATLAPFQLPGASVYQLMIQNAHGRDATMLTLWPSLHRVDAISPSSAVVFTDVRTVDIVGEIEVQFRRSNRDYLIVARGGKVIVRA
ncbi:MAG: hypothetical protein IT335_07550 [Thermomicrobiales bacterium]|jgi:hypothetical protein|nr:hypothetical protein [Thermomicrobiales bacterium]